MKLSPPITLLWLALGWVGSPAVPSARAGGEEVVVVYSSQSTDSRAVAEYYGLQRGVPPAQIIPLDTPAPAVLISRPDYVHRIQEPLIHELEHRGLMEFRYRTIPATNGLPEHLAYRCIGSKVRYLLLCWGLPYIISEDPKSIPSTVTNVAPQMRRTDASVDSELVLLPVAGSYELMSAVNNPVYSSTNLPLFHPTNGVFLVTRLDGPTPALARGLIDKAIAAETHGLSGNAYIDLRDIHGGGYKTGDDWITNAGASSKRLGYPTFFDHRPETLPATFPMSHVGLYFGWYSWNADGPFTRPDFEFQTGAIAYHLHSFSAADLRSPVNNWVGPFIAKGVTATMGCVAEPYLDLTPNPHVLIELLGILQATLGEAGVGCQHYLSWQNVIIGDPLYRPFGRNWFQWEPIQTASNDPNLEWTLLYKVNFHLLHGRDPTVLRTYLIEQPLTLRSAILSEKVALMFADDSRLRQAIEWGVRAAGLSQSLQQRTRIRLNLAEWQEMFDLPADAFATLLEVEHERPDYRDLTSFRQRQLTLARSGADRSEVDRLKQELKRLATPSPEKSGKP